MWVCFCSANPIVCSIFFEMHFLYLFIFLADIIILFHSFMQRGCKGDCGEVLQCSSPQGMFGLRYIIFIVAYNFVSSRIVYVGVMASHRR
jgi:hypothetical protein